MKGRRGFEAFAFDCKFCLHRFIVFSLNFKEIVKVTQANKILFFK